MRSSLADVYRQACSDAAVLPNSALTRCFAATNHAMPLQVLSLSHNLIGPRGLVALLPVLHECRHTLQSVDLSHNNLDNGSIRMLVRCFANGGFAALRRLELRGNLLTYQGGKCLIHWCEGLQTVRQARGSRDAGAGEASRKSAADLAAATPSDALRSSLLSTEYWCDAVDVHIDYIGIEDTAMPEMLQRALQQRIAAAIAGREARRLDHSLQRSSRISAHKSALVADITDTTDSRQHSSAGTNSVQMSVPEGLPSSVGAHPLTLSLVEGRRDDIDEQQHHGGVKVVATEAPRTEISCFLECDADMNALRQSAYGDASAYSSVPAEAEESDASGDNSTHRSSSSTAVRAAGPPLTAHVCDEQQPLSGRRRSGPAAGILPFLCHSSREDSGSDVRCAALNMCPASLPFTSSPSSDALTLRPKEPSATQQQRESWHYSSPPPVQTALNILDEWALEAVDQTTGGAGEKEDADELPMWLVGP
ncbi:hypothetical protein CUR178_06285 [Leishmania enriettii]|uniref:Leucine-rich repeat protein n=1 Tax=Leishmania enriettii TaxID=5663 RepID=A0A836KLS0_LEIEN|nr:hypothetical protein CUR178_06285 [Leishmania enriettii]